MAVNRLNHDDMPVTLVLVTNQFACDRLIQAGRTVADMSGTPLAVLSVMNPRSAAKDEALEYLYQVSKEHGAGMMVRYSDQPKKEIVATIKAGKIANIITGLPEGEHSILYKMYRTFLHIHFFTVSKEGVLEEARALSAQPS